MSFHHRNYRAVIKPLLFTWLLFSGSTLMAQQGEPKPVSPTTEAPHKSNEAPDEEVQLHNQERYSRVPVIGPITEGGAPIALDPPSDDEVLQALEKARPTRGGLRLLREKHGNNVKIVKEKIADYVDPPRFVPLIGMAQLHHAHYKCTICFSERTINGWPIPNTLEDSEASEVIYIDHNHFHLCGNGPSPASRAPQASQTFNFSMGFERGESLELLKQRCSELEQQTHQLAHKLKQSISPSETERKELQAAVRKSFEARQTLQRAELADLAQRMKSMQHSIDMRDKLADKVIERRVEDLLNPNLKWDLRATKERTLDGPNSESKGEIAPAAQSTPNISSLTPGGSATLPPSMVPAPTSVPYDPGRRPETVIRERIQGHWVAESMLSAGKDSLKDLSEPFEVLITGNEMRFRVGTQDLHGPMLLTGPKGSYRSLESADQPLPIEFVMDPNGEHREMPGIIACDGSTLSICFADQDESHKNSFRPTSFIPGSKVVVIKCYRLTDTVPGNEPIDVDLTTPQATLDYLHRHSSKIEAPDWNEFLKQFPVSGTALVMFSSEPGIKEQMLSIAQKVAAAASIRLIELPLSQSRDNNPPTSTHYLLMKDRQLIGIRSGVMTETELREFVAEAINWLTPHSTGVDENSLVRVDCYIFPGAGHIGNQHGEAFPITTAVIAFHEDQAVLFGPDSVAEYMDKGYACVAVVRDAAGKQKQLPLEVLLKGPVKLLGRNMEPHRSIASVHITNSDGTSRELPIGNILPDLELMPEPLEKYDVDSAIYQIRGVHGLKPVKLAAIEDAIKVDQRVLSGSFARQPTVPPILGFSPPMQWQTQTVQSADGVFGGNMHGPELFDVLCPTIPVPSGFTFNDHGRLIGKYAMGSPSYQDMTHTVFKSHATHSILQAALGKISDTGLKAALAETLKESQKSWEVSMKKPAVVGETH